MFFVRALLKNIRNPLVSILALIDQQSVVSKKAKINRFARIRNSNIDSYSYIGPSTRLENCDIGKFCSISWDCCLGLASHEVTQVSTSPIFSTVSNGTGASWLTQDMPVSPPPRTRIGNDVWIGASVIVLEGVVIGDGAVIGAGAVVTKSVDPYSIVGGVPARKIGMRFSDEIVHALLEKKWWNAPEQLLKENVALFQKCSPDLEDVYRLPQGF